MNAMSEPLEALRAAESERAILERVVDRRDSIAIRGGLGAPDGAAWGEAATALFDQLALAQKRAAIGVRAIDALRDMLAAASAAGAMPLPRLTTADLDRSEAWVSAHERLRRDEDCAALWLAKLRDAQPLIVEWDALEERR